MRFTEHHFFNRSFVVSGVKFKIRTGKLSLDLRAESEPHLRKENFRAGDDDLDRALMSTHFDPRTFFQSNDLGCPPLEKAPLIGQNDVPPRPREEPHGKLVFEAANGRAERGRRNSEAFRRPMNIFVASDPQKIAKFEYFHYRNDYIKIVSFSISEPRLSSDDRNGPT
jgi:hypothetical protein